jgi:hypothetical protein
MAAAFWSANEESGDVRGWNQLYATGWDTVILGGLQMPGVCEVDCETQRHVQKKKGQEDGARPTYRGQDPAPVTIKVKISTSEQWAKYQEVKAKLWPAGGKGTPAPLPISHPSTEEMRVHNVIIKKVTSARAEGAHGVRVSTWTCEEFFPPKKSHKKGVATPTAPRNVLGAGLPPDGTTPANAPKGRPSSTDVGP